MILKFKALILLAIALSAQSYCQVVIDQKAAFSGRNVYAPTIIYDDQSSLYKMWYGGWQSDSDYPNDKIYYRTSRDGEAWSAPTTIMQPSQIPVASEHVNDPSVTKHYNTAARAYQYTMFFVNCIKPCTENSHNQIWSAVSGDGINWGSFQVVLGEVGASTPSAVIDQGNDNGFFSLYYINTAENNNNPKTVLRARVDGNRHAISTSAAFTYTNDSGNIANPEVRRVGSIWSLVFNVYHTVPGASHSTADIFIARSSTSTYWPVASEKSLISNDPSGPFCNSIAPGILPRESEGKFWLYFSSSPYSPGVPSCNPTDNTAIQRWVFQQ